MVVVRSAFVLAVRTPLALAFTAALLFVGCGRSSLIGAGGVTCPNGDVTCINNDGGPINGDGGPGIDGFTSCGQCAQVGCDQPGCCACGVCQGALFCQNIDGGSDAGDAGDTCVSQCDAASCVGDPLCHVLGTEICNNGIDDNDNGLIDCADPECSTFPGCQVKTCPTPVDCTLPACVAEPACQDLKCHPTVDFGTLQPMGSSSTKSVDTTGTKDIVVTPCAPGGGGMVVGQFTVAGTADVTLSFTQAKGEDHVFGLFIAGVNQPCGANPVSCYDPKGALTGSNTFQQLAPGLYYIITQAFEPAGQGPVSVTLSTPLKPEICNNGIDDNGNGLIDCQEASCATAPNCINQECTPDINLGALVANGPGQSTSFTTVGATPNNTLPCEGADGGGDIVVEFTLDQTAGILVDWSQMGDHVLGLVKVPPPGQGCAADIISCYDPSGRQMDSVAFDNQPAGTYAIIFKATKPGDEGEISATISAFAGRDIELCHNGIDDNNNGLIDCQDPQCFGVAGCSAPYCQPDVQFGNMVAGSSMSTVLDIKDKGIAGYGASCAKGGGKGMVVQLTVATTSGAAIGFDCTQTGDQVISLYQAGGPRDKCDFQELVCADPTVLPFGCGYDVPNLDPGTYNVIVEGFEAGSEGTMNLTLSVEGDRVQEICNNGIDDNNNGLIDCADPDCALNPDCASVQCHPDATINPMPLDGSTVFKLVQTAGNGTPAPAPCATTTGGQGAVIQISLTADANLQLEWNQIGNHDFALYTQEGSMLPCNAGAVLGCQKSGDQAQGTIMFNKVPQGVVYLVIAADAPDVTGMQSSGSVSVALSGTPAP